MVYFLLPLSFFINISDALEDCFFVGVFFFSLKILKDFIVLKVFIKLITSKPDKKKTAFHG